MEKMLYALGKKLGICLEVSVYEHGESLLAEVNKGFHYDIVYLDIEMEGMDGIRVAEELRKQDRVIQIIYVTQYEHYIWQSIDTMPSGYLVKPVDPDEFERVFQKISGWIQGKDAYYRFTSDKNLIYRKLDQIEQELEAENQKQFLRIHQSYLVNYNYIRCFGHNWVELKTGKQLPMSRHRRELVEKRLGGA